MQSLHDTGEPATRRHPPAARHADMEARGLAEMPILPQGRWAPPVRVSKKDEATTRALMVRDDLG
jgi:hypothetical protein